MSPDPTPLLRHRLDRLLAGLVVTAPQVQVAGLSLDSRGVRPGEAFLACRGRSSHGLAHLDQALANGAGVVLWEPGEGVTPPELPQGVVGLPVVGLSAHAGLIADRFHGEPSAALRVVGITGTNGKTTCAYLLAQAATLCGVPGAYLGTIGFGRPDQLQDAGLTTPDALTVQRRLAEARDDGAAMLGLEVSSHALDQQRVAAVRFDTAVLTNLTRDHLDYHGTLAAYAAAKARLFESPGLLRRVLNCADPFGRELAARSSTAQTIGYSADPAQPAPPHGAWLNATALETSANGLALRVESHAGGGWVRTRLIGGFNADNLLAVLAVLLGWGVNFSRAAAALAECVAPPGRMQSFGGERNRPLAIVDYAHSPDALDKALRAARAHARGRLLCVFGCGGDRDPGKRPLMGGIAESLADLVYVTDDNPRSEDPLQVRRQVLQGMRAPARAIEVGDRARAIALAIASGQGGDVVLIAGKGHEDYQIVGREVHHFSDREQVLAALEARP
jgi:UDP-N-acetylmuramoyl-L-alanyl-D-glutamate--2,6-diaminopimelate ligase